jgi:hypothetical protein
VLLHATPLGLSMSSGGDHLAFGHIHEHTTAALEEARLTQQARLQEAHDRDVRVSRLLIDSNE